MVPEDTRMMWTLLCEETTLCPDSLAVSACLELWVNGDIKLAGVSVMFLHACPV